MSLMKGTQAGTRSIASANYHASQWQCICASCDFRSRLCHVKTWLNELGVAGRHGSIFTVSIMEHAGTATARLRSRLAIGSLHSEFGLFGVVARTK